MTDQVRWFEALGRCSCGKEATGTLRGPRNESYGNVCSKCGNARAKQAERERNHEQKALEEEKQVNYYDTPPYLEFAGMAALISAEILAWAWWRGFWP